MISFILYLLTHILKMVKKDKQRVNRAEDVVSREYTINLHKRLHGQSFKDKAPRALKEVTPTYFNGFVASAMCSFTVFCR